MSLRSAFADLADSVAAAAAGAAAGALSGAAEVLLGGAGNAPSFLVIAGDEPLTPDLEVRAISVTHEVNRVPSARVVLLDGDAAARSFPLSARPTLQPGKSISILLGMDSENLEVFNGVITRLRIRALRHSAPELILECRDKCTILTRTRRSRCMLETTDAEAIELICGESEIGAEVVLETPLHAELVQFNATDWDFIIARAEANGGIVIARDGMLGVIPASPPEPEPPIMVLTYGSNLFEFEAQSEDTGITTSIEVKAESWDANILEPALSGEGTKLHLTHGGARSEAELEAWAMAAAGRAEVARMRGRARVSGSAKLMPGEYVALEGMGGTFDGKVVLITAVRHEMVRGEWTSDVQFGLDYEWFHQRHDISQPGASGLLPAVSGLQIGIVTRIIDDPEDLYRVQVRLPLVDATSPGVWARVARVDAGPERGVVFWPEVGDEVVLGFLNADPRDAVVLGSLHSTTHPSPIAAEELNMVKGITTRSQLKLHFDDEKRVLAISTPEGNQIVLSEETSQLSITDQSENSIVMNPEGIKLTGKEHVIELGGGGVKIISQQNIDLTAVGRITVNGEDISLTAEGQFKGVGAGGVEVSSAATAVLKGGIVNIN